jgi:hypothetical protein
MTVPTIATVVEGQGEVAAVPALLRRIVAEVSPETWINVPRPYRIGRDSLIKAGGIEAAVAAVAEQGGVRTADPEQPRDCKGWLTARRIDKRSYKPAADQAALAEIFDLAMARTNSPSFDKLWRDVERLTKGMTGRASG